MKNNVAKLVIAAAIASVAMFAADNTVGTWRYNAAKSKSTSVNPIKSQTDVREATDGGAKLTRTTQFADGSTASYSISFKYDGKEYPATGAPYDSVSVKRIDANTYSFETKKTGGKYHMMGQTVISKDGKTLTQNIRGTDSEGKPVTNKAVFEKQ